MDGNLQKRIDFVKKKYKLKEYIQDFGDDINFYIGVDMSSPNNHREIILDVDRLSSDDEISYFFFDQHSLSKITWDVTLDEAVDYLIEKQLEGYNLLDINGQIIVL